MVQFFFVKYNSESDLTLSVPSGSESINKDFTLIK